MAHYLFLASVIFQTLLAAGALLTSVFTIFRRSPDGKIRFSENVTSASGYIGIAAVLCVTAALTAKWL